MIPSEHILILAVVQFTIGLIGVLVRRTGSVVVVSALIMFNSNLLAVCAVLAEGHRGFQSTGAVVLSLMVAVALVGAAILFCFHRFRRAVALDDYDRMKH
jgi:NADH:ubiquinone oxidoreductase subunit K